MFLQQVQLWRSSGAGLMSMPLRIQKCVFTDVTHTPTLLCLSSQGQSELWFFLFEETSAGLIM